MLSGTRTALILCTLALAPFAFAGQDTNYLAQRLIDDAGARQYLKLTKDSSYADLESVSVYKMADLDGDGTRDFVVNAFNKGASVVAGFIKKKDGALCDTVFAGYTTSDSDFRPSLETVEIFGDERHSIRIESLRTYEKNSIVKTLTIASFNKQTQVFTRNFRTQLDAVDRHGIYRQRTVNVVSFEDTDKDGIKEILIAGRQVETYEKNKKEIEIEPSVTTAKYVYSLKESANARFKLTVSEVDAPTPTELLQVAVTLAEAGANTRAAIIAHDLIRDNSLKGDALVSAKGLLIDDETGAASDTVVSNAAKGTKEG